MSALNETCFCLCKHLETEIEIEDGKTLEWNR